MIASIHQPQYLPYIGFFHKLSKSDIFILLDDVPATSNDFTNRNRIRTMDGWMWLTVPVLNKNKTPVNQIKIQSSNWGRKHWNSIIANYGKAPYFSEYSGYFKKVFEREWDMLVDLDEELLHYIAGKLNINIPFIKSSELGIEGAGTERLISICKEVGADSYLSGIGGKDYLDEVMFKKENIKLIYQEFQHPVYRQRFEDFEPNMSIIDLLFNCGGSGYLCEC